MANAFYSLYSHVSRTPLQKLATPEFTFSSPVERIERFRSSVRSEPRSPVERLKDTVSKMCLYTGSPRGSDSTSPQASPKKRTSLPDVVGAVLKVRPGASKNLQLGESNRSISGGNAWLHTDGDQTSNLETLEPTKQILVDTDICQYRNNLSQMDMKSKKQSSDDGDDENPSESRVRRSLASTLSGETVIDTVHQVLSCQPELDCSRQRDTRKADLKPAAKVTYDLICPQIVESVHQAPFCCQHTHNPQTDTLPPVTSASRFGSRKQHLQTVVSEPEDDSCAAGVVSVGDATRAGEARSHFSVLAPSGSYTHYCITVTGWERDSVSPDSSRAPSAPLAQTCEEFLSEETSHYLNPLTHRVLGHVSNSLRQANSFELEEVQC